MILEFRVRNFRSFRSEQRLRFHTAASHARTDSAVVFGPHGTGKSNLLRALRTMREFVLRSASFSEADIAARYTPFRPSMTVDHATVFSIEIFLGDARYSYSFAYDMQRILSEQLRVYRMQKCQRWFERRYDSDTDAETWRPFSSYFFGNREAWRTATKPQALFLTTATQLGAGLLAPLLHWFEHQLVILFSAEIADLDQVAARLRDAAFKRSILGILRAVDESVADVRVLTSQRASGGTSYPKSSVEFQYVRDGSEPVWLDSRQDTSNALWLVLIVVPLLDGTQGGKLIAVDDFDTHLHPLVARLLIQMLKDPAAPQPAAQVLLISQTTALLDLQYLRRDELWLMESDDYGSSRLKAMLAHATDYREEPAERRIGRDRVIPEFDLPQAAGAMPPTQMTLQPLAGKKSN